MQLTQVHLVQLTVARQLENIATGVEISTLGSSEDASTVLVLFFSFKLSISKEKEGKSLLTVDKHPICRPWFM